MTRLPDKNSRLINVHQEVATRQQSKHFSSQLKLEVEAACPQETVEMFSTEPTREIRRAPSILLMRVSVSPCWSQDSPDQTGPAWQPVPSQYPHRNTGKPDQTPPGPEASPAATSSEHRGLRNTFELLFYLQ